MATVTTGRGELSATLDPHLFTFKPKLNQKSSEIAQNLISGFYERQLQHTKRLQEFKELAANNYGKWYCREKRVKPQNESNKATTENKLISDETSSAEDNDISSAPTTIEENRTKERLARLVRVYGAALPRRTGLPSARIQTRVNRHVQGRSGSSEVSVAEAQRGAEISVASTATVLAPPAQAPPLPPLSQHVPVSIRPFRRISPIVRPKSPAKVVRQPDISPKRPIINDSINIERLKLARDEAERAMKEHKIFTIIGPYPALREALRRRGWIEKFDRGPSLPGGHGNKKSDKKNNKSDDDDDDDTNDDELGDDDLDESPMDDDEDKIQPWEENDGYYGLLSRLVKTAPPDFIWSVQASYDTSSLNKDQMVNHYSRNGCFTTKVGLCSSLKSLPWFYSGCADEFYPRCYKITHEDDKIAFIDDYRLTSCISFLKVVQNRCRGIMEPDMNSILAMSSDDRSNPSLNPDEDSLLLGMNILPSTTLSPKPVLGKIPTTKKVPSSYLEFALKKVEQYALACDHEDIDISLNLQNDTTDEQWAQFIEQFYAASHSFMEIEGMEKYLNKIDQCLKNVEQNWPQYHIDGTRNIWILKPGAKSRGRGIVVYDRLDDILKLTTSSLVNDRKFVVQKYIERPLLIHNTKFDIRQWFLVTDWNPLTIWMFKDCYLRFCTEHFSLSTTQQSVHLCNYSIQKHYKNNSNRHADLPVENMWTNAEFIEKYLKPNKLADKWDSFIYPAMKDSIICSMLVAQDTIEPRKNSFELFGADFMLGEDLKPWLIEINCSPTMARCTAVTTEMCDGVLEDTCKLIIDRKYNRVNDTGRFELIHKGLPVPVPIYIGIDLRIEGKTCKTNRTHNNNSNTNGTHNNNNNNATITTPVSAPPQVRASKDATADNDSNQLHSISALDANHDRSSSKNGGINQPSGDYNDIASSTDSILDRVDNNQYRFHSNNRSTNGARRKQSKVKSNRISANILSNQQLNPPKLNDRVPSPKETKPSQTHPYFRQCQRSALPQRIQEQQLDKNSSPSCQRPKTTLTSLRPNPIPSIPTSSTLTIIDAGKEHITVIAVA
ncbi:unnamed protein product [Rotaria socialis]|uniref:Tubulin glycylase 3A n=2 Tax=Rotaria socialis TaxID=392032 RepID=A0A817QG67_9BILA|nr:unnamed protein product [Rotaria socialis]